MCHDLECKYQTGEFGEICQCPKGKKCAPQNPGYLNRYGRMKYYMKCCMKKLFRYINLYGYYRRWKHKRKMKKFGHDELPF